MIYIVRTFDVPFACTPPETIVVAKCGAVDQLADALREARQANPGVSLEVVETLFTSSNPKEFPTPKLIPPELARAVEAWNAMCGRVRAKLPRVMKPAQYVAPYRRWKRENAGRTYLLEDVVAAAETAIWSHEWIDMGYLFGKKNGTHNSDKLLGARGPARRAGGNGKSAADYEPAER